MRLALASLLLGFAACAFGQASEIANPDPAVEQRLKGLADELRCLVCQNQTIADSNAPLAVDLRQQIRTQIAQGRSDSQIRDYMVQRYGDFVLYRPPLRATTALLWIGPFAFLAAGLAVYFLLVRRRRGVRAEVPPEKRAEIEALLEGREPPTSAGRPSGKRPAP